MRSRQTLLDIFSTFLRFEEDAFRGWTTDAHLRRRMQSCLQQIDDANASEHFWATYWHKRWQSGEAGEGQERNSKLKTQNSKLSPLIPHPSSCPPPPTADPLGHLSAYLQESCYWSAQRIMAQLPQSQQQLSDCFQVAIVAVPKILNAFDSDQLVSLKTYASQAFSNTIRDDLRRRREADRCNDWGLLLKLSRKQLTEALQNAGLGNDERDRYLLAWTCFEAVYIPQKAPGLRQLTAPDRPTWSAITDRYNQQRHQLASPGSDCNPEMLERWLVSCVSQVRAYLYPRVTSLNAPKPGQDAGELQDDVPDRDRDSLLTTLINAEETQARQTQQHKINAVLKESLAKLNPTMQELLQLYYQARLTQQQIAQQFALQQYTVSRKLTKARETLLLALTCWSQETLYISPTSDVVKSMSAILEEWLQVYYQVDDSPSRTIDPNRDFQEYL